MFRIERENSSCIKILLTIFASFIALSAASPVASSERDPDRPIESVGLIVCKQGGNTFRTNAALVERRDLVLGVSHFNYDAKSGRELAVSNCSFQLRNASGQITFRSAFEVADRGASREHLRESHALDWAVIRLDRTAPADPLRLGSLDVALSEQQVELHARGGYRSNSSYAGSVKDCSFRRDRPRSIVIRHQCETQPGYSGAPLVSQGEDGPEIVAVHAKRAEGFGIAVGLQGSVRTAIRTELETTS